MSNESIPDNWTKMIILEKQMKIETNPEKKKKLSEEYSERIAYHNRHHCDSDYY